MTPFLYRLLRPLARAVVFLFFRRLEVRGADQVPLSGPLLVAANHPNMLLDPLLLGTTQPRSLSFLAKATLFRSQILARFLGASGVLPVYRRSDSPGESAKNEITFDACFRHLEKGGAIGIFPEGLSHDRQAVLPLKTGCARITLEAEERKGFSLGVRITPVSLYFTERHVFRSDALVVYGAPIDPSPYFGRYRQDPQEAVRSLTAELQAKLEEITVHVPRTEDEALVRHLGDLLAHPSELAGRVEADRGLVDAIDYFRENDPARYARLRREVLRFSRLVRALGLEPGELERSYRWWPVLRYLVPRLVLAVASLPVFLYGALNNFVPYKVPKWTARLLTRDRVEIATVKLLTGMISFPLFYTAQTALVAHALSPGAAFVYAVTLPISGLAALAYLEALSGFGDEVRLFGLHVLRKDQISRLRARGEAIGRELDLAREAYLSSGREVTRTLLGGRMR